jgi:predicted O-linked N-acetylglucosamine transferase (SPINDLY family)
MSVMTVQQAFELAAQHQQAHRFADAEWLYRQVLGQIPEQPDCLYGLGGVLLRTGRAAEAAEVLGRASAQRPDNAIYQFWLGSALTILARFDDAIAAFQRAVDLKNDFVEAMDGLGSAYFAKSDYSRAIAAYQRALRIRPEFPEAVLNLSSVLINCGHLEEPIVFCREAIGRWPDFLMFYRTLGWAYRESGRLDEAIDTFRQALARKPDPQIHSDLLFTLHFHDGYDRRRLYEEHARFNEIHAKPLASQIQPHRNEPNPQRRLRVGYVAFDLGDNPLGRFLLPLLANHDPAQVEFFCYCDHPRPDETAARLRRHGQWRATGGMSHEQLAELVRNDGIDVLVDLAMHSNNNRMLAFARKPAPVQVTYLAYCGTTGLEAMDYRLTDRFFDPSDQHDSCYSERSFRLPDCYWSYAGPEGAPEVGPLPAATNGSVTFGCLNEFSKVTPRCLSTFCRLLREVPNSRLVLHAKEGSHRQRAIEQASLEGIDPARIEFFGRNFIHVYMAQYNRIDIALDPFPWAGGATSCDALYMGAPLVSLAGQTGVSRGGLSILSNLGLSELVVRDVEEYVRIASKLARDVPRLTELRGSLRDRMKASPLMDASRFARGVEAAFRQMWREWCASHGSV